MHDFGSHWGDKHLLHVQQLLLTILNWECRSVPYQVTSARICDNLIAYETCALHRAVGFTSAIIDRRLRTCIWTYGKTFVLVRSYYGEKLSLATQLVGKCKYILITHLIPLPIKYNSIREMLKILISFYMFFFSIDSWQQQHWKRNYTRNFHWTFLVCEYLQKTRHVISRGYNEKWRGIEIIDGCQRTSQVTSGQRQIQTCTNHSKVWSDVNTNSNQRRIHN